MRYILTLTGLLLLVAYYSRLSTWVLPHEQEDMPLYIVGEIVSIPIKSYQQTKFDFIAHHPERLLRLNWHDAPQDLRVGDRWQLRAKLKRIHGVHNPGSFDYEAWAAQHGVSAVGSIVHDKQNKRITHYFYVHPLDQVRQAILATLIEHLPHSATAHWLIALALGERANVPQEQWQVLRHTGTNHLMAIGGLHIGMVAGFIYFITSWIWRRAPMLMIKLPAQEAASYAALLCAWLYGALSGFAIPAQRACLMLTIYIACQVSRRKINPWLSWSISLFIVLVIAPFSVMDNSFWLSFGTIALIIFGMGGRLAIYSSWLDRFWWKYGRVQWVIGLGLLPLSVLFFQECSLISFLANSIAIPWLACLILPFCLLGTLCIYVIPMLGDGLLYFADKSLMVLWWLLESLSHWQFAVWAQAMPNWPIFTVTLCGILLIVMPMKFPARWLGVVWLAPLVLYLPPQLAVGEASITLLDVGQGLSAVVQTRHHVLVFDAGPPTPSVVVPYLRSQFIRQIDLLVVSHGDMDHIGGVNDVLNDMAVKAIATSVPEKFTSRVASLCLSGQHWQWDGVDFRFIYPYPDTLRLGNDSSCVLRVEAGHESVLIPGDIERFAELTLLERSRGYLGATMIVAPHHGSHTSGLPEFIQAVYPRYVLYATGYRNRYHFPHSDVMQTYAALHSEAFDTAKNGAIHWYFGKPS